MYPQCYDTSQNRLGYAALENDSQVSVAHNTNIYFLPTLHTHFCSAVILLHVIFILWPSLTEQPSLEMGVPIAKGRKMSYFYLHFTNQENHIKCQDIFSTCRKEHCKGHGQRWCQWSREGYFSTKVVEILFSNDTIFFNYKLYELWCFCMDLTDAANAQWTAHIRSIFLPGGSNFNSFLVENGQDYLKYLNWNILSCEQRKWL